MEHTQSPGKKSWSIYGRTEITTKYAIEERVGSGAYSDVYRARRLSDATTVALKEVHDQQSAFREIDALRRLQDCPNIVVLHEYFWGEGEDAVLVLEFLRSDLATVIKEGKRGITAGERKGWMLQILSGVDSCHRNLVVHRDLKPGNLLIGDDGVLKLADFGQARILMESSFDPAEEEPQVPMNVNPVEEADLQVEDVAEMESVSRGEYSTQDHEIISRDDYYREMSKYKPQSILDDPEKTAILQDGGTSCLATGTASDAGDDAMRTSFTYEVEDEQDDNGGFTSCVGTRWYRAPELLYGSTYYGMEIDLWSLGCIFSELFNLDPLFPGTSDIDQLSRILSVLGNVTEDVWPGCSNLPDYKIISFGNVEKPKGLDACHPGFSPAEVSMVKKLVCYNPTSRATAMELLHEDYFRKDPLPVPLEDLRVPLTRNAQVEDDAFDSDMEMF